MKKVQSLTLTPFLILFFSIFVYASTPMADWHMDECSWSGANGEVKDSSGNGYDGAEEGSANTTSGKLCKAGGFAINGDRVRIKNFPNLTEKFTITAWFNTKNPSETGQRIFIDDGYPSKSGYALSLGDDSNRHVRFYHRGNTGDDILDTTYQIEADKWYFVAAVFDKNKKHIYLYDSGGNLLEHVQKSYTIDLKESNNDAFIGGVSYSNTSDTYSFDGSIDEVKVFNKDLNKRDIEKIVDNEKDGKNYDGTARSCPSCLPPIVDYHLDECNWSGVGGEVKDSSGNGYNLTPQNGASTSLGGELCKSGDFGSNSKISGTWNKAFTTKVSLVAWIKTSKNQQPYARVVEFSNSSGDYQHSTALAFDSTGKIIRGWTTGASRSTEVSYDLRNHGYFDNKWHQIVYVYDGSSAKLYIDKELKNSKNTNIGDIVDGQTLTIGGYYSGTSYYFTGQIDEVKIFDDALSDSRIGQIYSNETSGRDWDGSLRVCSSCSTPIADYRLDECSWDGISADVKDSSGNNHNATAINGANTESNTTANGGLFRVGDFNNSLNQHLKIDNFPKLKDSRTITSWIKVAKDVNGRIFADDKSNRNGDYALSYKDPGSKRVRFYIRGLNPVSLDSSAVIEKNKWYFVVAKFDSNNMKKYLYIYDSNGNQIDNKTQNVNGTLVESEGKASIGGELSNATPEANGMQFDGNIDEVKVFDVVLSDGEIDDIYEYEKIGKNWDGSSRDKPCCAVDTSGTIIPLEFEGAHITLNVSTNPPHWTHVDFNQTFSSVPVVFTVAEAKGAHPASVRIKNINKTGFDAMMAEPQGEDGPHLDQSISFLAVNKGLHKIGNTYFQVGSIDTKKYQQASKGVRIHNEWEKISTIFSSCNPVVVANIQSLRNEKGLDIPDPNSVIRSIPWLTTAVDVNDSGVYLSLERSETDEGNISQDETIGYMVAPANIQDSVVDDNGNNIFFETIRKKDYFVGWDNSCKEVNFINTYDKIPLIAANKNSKNEMDGGWFRRCKLNQTEVGFQIDEDGSIYSKTIYDYNSTYQDTERRHAPETGGIFAFSDTIVIHENPQVKNYKFDAWDSFRDISDRHISTKIANQNFNLTIASLDENGTNYQDFNGTVCATLDSVVSKLLFINQSKIDTTFKISKAIKDVRVHLSWKKNVDENCPLSSEDNATFSSDNFAIRPKEFKITQIDANMYAGDNFQLKFDALDGSSSDTADYNESKDSSFQIDANITKSGCYNGLLKVDNFSFTNGLKSAADANYSDIGDVNVTIKEKLGSEFGVVDVNDTSETDRLITPFSKIITVKPYELNVTSVEFSTSTGNSWLYMSDLNTLAQRVKSTIQANDKFHNIVQNFTTSCYAKDINVSNTFYVNNSNSQVKLTYDVISGLMLNSSKDIADINKTITLPKSIFTTSKADVNYRFNIDRDYKKPYNPIIIGLRGVDITSVGLAKVNNNATSDINTTFYYGRVKTKDIDTNKQSVQHSLGIEVYSTANLSDFHQDSLSWYGMKDDSITKIVDFLPKKDFTMSTAKSGISDINSTQSIANGIVGFTITNSWSSSDSAYIHIKIPLYLWYSRYNAYDDNSSSDCGEHPCFKYNYLLGNDQKNIQSGDFNGTSIGSDYNASKVTKKGVKVFR